MSPLGLFRVLLIEDNPGDRRLVREKLARVRQSRFAVEEAESLARAFEMLAEKRYDAALLDLTLPDSRGLDTLHRLREREPKLPVVLLSVSDDDDLAVAAVRAGAQECLEKLDLTPNGLARAVRHAVQRSRSDEALEAARRRLEAAERQAHLGSWELELATGAVSWSNELYRMYGLNPRDVQPSYEAFLSTVHPQDRERIEALTRGFYLSPRDVSFENRVLRGESDVRVHRSQIEVELDASGAPRALLGSVLDVTESKASEAALRRSLKELAASERRFRNMAESISQVFWMTSVAKDKILYISPAYESIWGRTCEALYRRPKAWLDAIVAEDRPAVLEAARRQAIPGAYDQTYRIARPDGSIRWIRDRAFPVTGPDGAVETITGVAEDVTDQKLAEEARRESEASLEAAQAVARVGSWVYELRTSDPLRWSKECYRLFGVPQGTRVTIEDFYRMIHPSDRQRVGESVQASVVDGSPYIEDYRAVLPDGSLAWIHARAEIVRDAAGEAVQMIGVVQDVTEQVDAKDRIAAAELQLRQAHKMEAVGRLAGGIAHDFNNLLTAILGMAELSLAELPKEHPVARDLEEIRETSLRAANLTQQLLAFSRRQLIEPKVLDLSDTIQGLAKMLRRLIGENIELSVSGDGAAAVIKADPGQVEQLVVNLAVNARDAMPQGGKLSVSTAVETLSNGQARERGLEPGRYAVLRVRDEGSGMSEETKAHLFEPFFTTKGHGKGTGLGLATCYGIVKQSGGAIVCESSPGAGTVFTIRLPCVKAQAQKGASPSRARAAERGTETVLVVEDEEPVRKLLLRVLRRQGYEVLEACDGKDGLRVVRGDKGRRIRLIVTDTVMPKLGGKKMADTVARSRPDIKVLFTSGYTDDVIMREGIVNSDIAFLRKPFTTEALAKKVRDVLGRRGLKRGLSGG